MCTVEPICRRYLQKIDVENVHTVSSLSLFLDLIVKSMRSVIFLIKLLVCMYVRMYVQMTKFAFKLTENSF